MGAQGDALIQRRRVEARRRRAGRLQGGTARPALTMIKQAVNEQRIPPGTLTLGADNRSAFTAHSTRLAAISALGAIYRRGWSLVVEDLLLTFAGSQLDARRGSCASSRSSAPLARNPLLWAVRR